MQRVRKPVWPINADVEAPPEEPTSNTHARRTTYDARHINARRTTYDARHINARRTTYDAREWMTNAPRSCWQAWPWQAREFDLYCRPLQAIHPVTFDFNRPPSFRRVACARRQDARRSSLGRYCRASASTSIART